MRSKSLPLKSDVKLLAIDMDGTLLDDRKQISRENKEAIRQAYHQGVHIVLCTGRPKSGIMPYTQELGLDDDYVIANNGSWLFKSSDWSTLRSHQLSREDLIYLTDVFDNEADINLVFFTKEANYALGQKLYPAAVRDAETENSQLYHVTLDEFLSLDIPVVVAIFMAEGSILDAFQNRVDGQLAKDFMTVRSLDYAYEALPFGVHKGRGLTDLAKDLDIGLEHVMVLGDGHNDLEMFDIAGLAVAMENATDSVKQKATAMTLSNNHSGVAAAINRFILTK
ncbi:Cof-type HAD-IIB family hydrolase [Streptococcus hyovaginalis]|uniref:Cof-type HAD-IIB family hydrolase n=1 Tax=Streptococcus hyovaginalis TaxID=149015 RepID=UPI002A91686C|nr:Cof-type HAD-IIB family hydrolase [Streptococcus hyovaginalis]MDY5973323.1 Cof-type HAD-IIB family hydrolase [Streptococcus hyovaginalis]